VPGNHRKLNTRDQGVHEEDVAVADPAGLHGDPYVAWAGPWHLTLDEL
jgi:hypothetical protein